MNISEFDPVLWKRELGKYIGVELLDGTKYKGRFHSMDTRSLDIAILEMAEVNSIETCKGVRIILGHAISRVRADEKEEAVGEELHLLNFNPFPEFNEEKSKFEEEFSEEEAIARQERLRTLFSQHRVPYSEEGTSQESSPGHSNDMSRHIFRVLGCLSVGWPYNSNACHCTNEIVLSRIQALLQHKSNEYKKEKK